MRCEEIQERFIDLLYSETGTPSASTELQAHIDSCPACRGELAGLYKVRQQLRAWKNEPPPQPVTIPGFAARHRSPGFALWPMLRYAGVAALLAVTLLSIGNAEITWNSKGFSFRSHGLTGRSANPDYYTKAEVRDILKKVLDDSESRMTDLNYMMIQRMMDTVEQDHMQELRYARSSAVRDRGKN